MNDYILFMHNDLNENSEANTEAAWKNYFSMLKASGGFSGGSSIGRGECVSKTGLSKQITSHISGYIRVQAKSTEDAKKFLKGNPVYESGGTVEIRELPHD